MNPRAANASLTDEFPAVFEVTETLHLDGGAYVKEPTTIGLLEGIQDVAGNSGIDLKFFPYLRTE